jgi:hypothetical protein
LTENEGMFEVSTGINKLCLVPKFVFVVCIPNGFLLLIKTPLPLCEGELDRKVFPVRLASLSETVGEGVGVGAGAGAGDDGLLGAHIIFFSF